MEQRICGASELSLSVLGVGCWQFGGGEYWGPQKQEDADAVVRAALEEGISYFDTAEAYNDGRSEEALGRAIRGIPRDRIVVGTKVSPPNAYRDTLVEHCERSLKRLGTDYVDLYMIHWPLTPHSVRHFTDDRQTIDSPPTVEEAVDALSRLRKSGKIRYAALSNFGPRPLSEFLSFGTSVAANQLPYNLLCRGIEVDLLPRCRRHGIGVIGYFTLLQGLLTDRYPGLSAVPEWQRRTRHFDSATSELARHGGAGYEAQTEATIGRIRDIGRMAGIPISSLAIRWAVSNPDITCALVGTRTPSRIRENALAASRALPPELLGALDEASRPLLEAMGAGFDYYESPENDRTV